MGSIVDKICQIAWNAEEPRPGARDWLAKAIEIDREAGHPNPTPSECEILVNGVDGEGSIPDDIRDVHPTLNLVLEILLS